MDGAALPGIGAVRQAAGTYSGDIGQALGSLDLVWGDEYEFGYDPQRGFWARRHGDVGWLAKAPTPEELGEKLAAAGPGTAP